MATNWSLKIFQAVGSRSSGNSSATVRFSNSDWALISRNSSSTIHGRAIDHGDSRELLRASSSRPWCTSQRGEKGMKIMPTKRITTGKICRQIRVSQAASAC
jgi:hypothetical protein